MNARHLTRCCVLLLCVLSWLPVLARAQVTGTALVRHAPEIDSGTVDGSVQQMLAEPLTLNGGAVITRDVLVPGTPVVRLNGSPAFAGTVDGSGGTSPSNYQITLNG